MTNEQKQLSILRTLSNRSFLNLKNLEFVTTPYKGSYQLNGQTGKVLVSKKLAVKVVSGYRVTQAGVDLVSFVCF